MRVQGQILDNNMRPIGFANVEDLGTGKKVTADEFGAFAIDVAGTNSQLRFSHAGFDYDTISAGDFNSYIELFPSSLSEVVINNNYKKSDNTLVWILGGALAIIAVRSLSKPQSKKITL